MSTTTPARARTHAAPAPRRGRLRVALVGAAIAVTGLLGPGTAQADVRAAKVTATVDSAALPGPGDEIRYSEIDVPQTLTLDVRVGETGLRLLDTLTGTVIPLREVTRDGDALRVSIPRLPVGRYRLETSGEDIVVRVEPEGGDPIELDTSPGRGNDMFWIVIALGVLAAIVVTLRTRRRGLGALVLVAVLGGGVVALTVNGETPVVTSWEQCDAYRDEQQREQFLLRRDCKVRYLVGLLERGETTTIGELLRREQDLDCHEIAHLAGFYYHRSTQDLERAARAMILGCSDGMVHGVLESMSVFMDDATFARELGALCDSLPDTPSQRTCYHGSGHATLWRANGNLYEAWRVCDLTRDVRGGDLRVLFGRITLQDPTYSSRAECRGAAIMEWGDRWEVERSDDGEDGLTPQLAEPMDLCRDNPADIELFEAECYLGSNYRTAEPAEAARRCNDVARWGRSCFMIIGDNFTQFAGRIHRSSDVTLPMVRDHAAICDLARDPDAGALCLEALASTAVVRGRLEPGSVLALCDELIGSVRQNACQRGVERALATLRSR